MYAASVFLFRYRCINAQSYYQYFLNQAYQAITFW